VGDNQVIIVHLPRMRDNRQPRGSRHGPDFPRFGNATHTIYIRLQDIYGAFGDQLAESVACELVLSTTDWRRYRSADLGVAIDIVRDDRLLYPLQVYPGILDHADHPDRVGDVPTHVRVGHQLRVRSNCLAHGADELEIPPHARQAVARTVSKTLLDGAEASLNKTIGVLREPVQIAACIEPASVDRDRVARPAA